jgi:hypothetical protein
VKTKSASLFSSRCCFTIFGEIAPIPSSYAPKLVITSKICLHLDVWDPLVLSREELVVSPFDYSGRRFGRLWLMVFPLKLRDFPRKKDWRLCVLIFYCCCSCSENLSLPKTSLWSGEKVLSLPKTSLWLGESHEMSSFLHICLMHMFPSDTSNDPWATTKWCWSLH